MRKSSSGAVIIERSANIPCSMNRMGDGTLGNTRTWAYVKEVYKALGVDSVGTELPPVV